MTAVEQVMELARGVGFDTAAQLDPKKIKNFAFRARHSGMGYISLDNIYLLGEDGKEVPMPKGLRRLR